MNRLKAIAILPVIAIAVMMAGCQKEETIPTHSQPGWTAVDDPSHDVTMTVIATLPGHLAGNATSNDEMAAFIGDECRGTANKVGNLYYIMVNGMESETANVYFRYFSANTGYMYRSAASIPFNANDHIGSADQPLNITFDIIKD